MSEALNPATEYFESRGVTERLFIVQAFYPGQGWRTFYLPLATPAIRKLRAAGFTSVAVNAGGRTADFGLDEFWSERVGLGQWRTGR